MFPKTFSRTVLSIQHYKSLVLEPSRTESHKIRFINSIPISDSSITSPNSSIAEHTLRPLLVNATLCAIFLVDRQRWLPSRIPISLDVFNCLLIATSSQHERFCRMNLSLSRLHSHCRQHETERDNVKDTCVSGASCRYLRTECCWLLWTISICVRINVACQPPRPPHSATRHVVRDRDSVVSVWI